jgi:putative nucleotidyltransferase with HDIG domain
MTISPHELVAGSVELATLPEVFIRVNEMIDDPHYSNSDIGRVIMNDPGMTVRLLKIVNSVYYSFPSQIDTVSRAITVVGTRELRDLILATSVVKMFKNLSNDLVTMETFWRHSVYCALTARTLAVRRRELHAERYFIAGLLHDIGSLIIYRKIPELAREALLRAQHNCQILHIAERDIMGFDHAAVGAELLRKWKLPSSLQHAVEFHHEPGKAPELFQHEASLVHIADIIADTMREDSSADTHVPPLDNRAWEQSGLTKDDIESVVAEVERQFDTVLKLIYFDTLANTAVAH